MKNLKRMLQSANLLLCVGCLVMCQSFVRADPPANYEGFGADTRGALAAPGGYTTYHVTNINESGEGSLRDALSAGSRLVVFDVGGTITLTKTLNIVYSYITIDGSTAPDPGITIALTPAPPTVSFQIFANARDITDVIIKYVRFDGQADSHPDTGGGDILAISADTGTYSIKNVIIDHVTAVRGQDGVFDTRWDVRNMTISYCFVFDTQCATIINGGTTEGRNIDGISWHHNVYARCDGRQPLLQRMVKNFDAVNNVVYGWGYFEAGEGGTCIMFDDGKDNPDAEYTKNYYYADPNAPYAIGHADQGAIIGYLNGTYGDIGDCTTPGNLTFTGNVFPPLEEDDVSYGTPTVIPQAYKPTEYEANTLGDAVVPFVGTQYPTDEERALLNEISLAIGGQGLPDQPAWDPPIGIPRPSFGIEENYRMYDDPENRNPSLTYTQNAEGGYYTHYIDNTNPIATDIDNLYGSANAPRRSIPLDLPAGSVAEIHGGPYIIIPTWVLMTAHGTLDRPVFVRGISKDKMPVLSFYLRAAGSYLILENLNFDNGRLVLHGNNDQDFVSIRYSEVQNSKGSGIWINSARDIVVYDNNIHHNIEQGPLVGDYGYSGIELWGAGTAGNTERVWIVDNHIHHNGEDAIQTYSGTSRYVYIGRNEMHDDRENAVDNKVSHDCIISQNKFYGYYPSDSSSGDAVRINDEGTTDNTWVLFNDISDCTIGIETYGAEPAPYIIGNKVYNLTAEGSRGIDGGSAGYVVNNVVWNFAKGIAEDNAVIVNNIVARASEYHIYGDVEIRNNVLWQNGGTITTRGSASPVDCLEADPLFVDAQNGDFHLSDGSPAIDAGIVNDVYQIFFDLYGIDIKRDMDGGVRPYGHKWDIGAYEWGSTPPDSGTEPEPEAEPEALMPDVTEFLVMNNIIKTGGNQSALIRCDMKEAGQLTVTIYDAKGKQIITICDQEREAGRHEFIWSGENSTGSIVGSGIYIVHMESGKYSNTKKIAIVK